MKSRPGIFIGLMGLFIALTVSLGYFVVRQSQQNEASVALKNSQYEQQKMDQQSKSIQNSDNHSQENTQSLTPIETTPTQTPTTKSQEAAPAALSVFFSKHPDSDNDPTNVTAVSRELGDSVTQQDALIQLFAGPTDDEKSQGFYGGINLRGSSTCSGKDFTLTISGGLATLQFCRYHVSGGDKQDLREEAQLSATLKQFGGISGVAVLDQFGHCIYAHDTNVCPNDPSH